MRIRSTFLLLCASTPAVVGAQATIDVPADAATIQAAIVAAEDGDTVRVAPGTYVEALDFLGKAITVESTGGFAVTLLRAPRGGPVVSFHAGEGADSVLRGFAVTGGVGVAGAVGAGISAQLVGEPSATPRIEACDVFANDAGQAEHGAGVGGDPVLVDCIVRDHLLGPMGNGGGVYGAPTVVRCTIENNVARVGAGLNLGAGAWVEDSLVVGNQTFQTAEGGGVHVRSGPVTLVRTCIVQNAADGAGTVVGRGGGVSVAAGATGVVLARCTVAANNASESGGVLGTGGIAGGATVRDSIVHGNEGRQAPDAVVLYSLIEGGHPGRGNRDADPLFRAPFEGDFTLLAASPGIDAGDPEAEPDPDGTRADMGYRPFPQATARVFGASGGNAACLASASAPVPGASWIASVDTAGALVTVVLVHAAPATVPLSLGSGELLLDPASAFLALSVRLASGARDEHAFPLPDDLQFLGTVGYAQAFLVRDAATVVPCNGLVVHVGAPR